MTDFHDLDETTRQIRETVSTFAQDRVAPLANQLDRDERFPRELWPEMGALGLHGMTVAEEDGGVGLGYLQHAIAVEEMSRASGSVGISYVAHSNLCINQIRRHASAEQRAAYLPRLLSGEHVGALAMSEAGAGSDVVSMRLRAERKGDRYILNGSKMWITNGQFADIVVVYAKTSPEAGKRGISTFIVETDTPGFSVSPPLNKMGMRGSGTSELVFQNCEVPAINLMGPLDGGVAVLMGGLDYERIIAAAACLGLMQAALDVAIPYVSERRQFGRAIGEFQLIQGKIADMMTARNAAQSYVYAVAKAADRGLPLRKEAASAILFASENATKVALDAIQLLGGNGYVNDYPAERIMRDAKLYEIGAGTNEIRRMLIGREMLSHVKSAIS